MSEIIQAGKRWSGADWADQQKSIMIVGQGGIGSYLSLCLSRIEHRLFIVDPDSVDETNVQGGQMFKTRDIGSKKVNAVMSTCREFGCTNEIVPVDDWFTEEMGILPITLTGLDNMLARKTVFEEWKKLMNRRKDLEEFLLIDGRLNLEDYEILCVQGNKPEDIEKYEREYLFDDSEVEDAPCTGKQTTYTAMGIASFMTAILCNWLTNKKLEAEFREIPFRTRIYYPAMLIDVGTNIKEEELI